MSTRETPLSRFTPSVMPHELLERLFVARERTLDAIMERVDAAASSEERNHTLLVGPRGAGKTHLVSLVYHRVNERRAAEARLQVSWLPEDPWTLVTYRHLLAAIVAKLEPSLSDDSPTTAEALESVLAERAAAAGPVVVIVENLDQILNEIGKEGQQRLRHLLQADRSLLLVATSTRLDRTLSDQASPFYGFFTTTRLEPFDVDEAAAMLSAIAQERGDEQLVEYLSGPEGRARLRTIAHLAGGQPRMWAALSSAVTVEGLKDLVDLLLTRFDDLTPYYQEQLARLSGQQRLVVAELAELDRPINVKELAERLEIDQRSLAKTISELVDRGWATPTSSMVTELLDKRRTYYELAEPLARLSFQIKESRGEPLRLVVDFLKHWFDPNDLDGSTADELTAAYIRLATQGQDRDPIVSVVRRLYSLPVTPAPANNLLGEVDDALVALQAGDPELFMRLPMPVRMALEERLEGVEPPVLRLLVHFMALAEITAIGDPAATKWSARAETLVDPGRGVSGLLCQLRAGWLARSRQFTEADEVVRAARDDADQASILASRAAIARARQEAGQVQESVSLWQALQTDFERILGPDAEQTIDASRSLAAAYEQADMPHEALAVAERLLTQSEAAHGPDAPPTLAARADVIWHRWYAGRRDGTMAMAQSLARECERVLGQDAIETIDAWHMVAQLYRESDRPGDAIEIAEPLLERARRMFGAHDSAALAIAVSLQSSYADSERLEEAVAVGEAMFGPSDEGDEVLSLVGRALLATHYARAGRAEEGVDLISAVLSDQVRLLGAEHPLTLGTKYAAIGVRRDAGRLDEAITLAEETLRVHERVFGVGHRAAKSLRSELTELYSAVGRDDDAAALRTRAPEGGEESPPARA